MEDDLSGLRSHKYFKHAISQIENNPDRDRLLSLHGAVIVKGGSILSIGRNKAKRNRLSDKYVLYENRTIHAECDAINIAKKKNLRGAKMYVARLYKNNGQPALSKPCCNCQNMISDHGIKKVYYTTAIGIDSDNVSNWIH